MPKLRTLLIPLLSAIGGLTIGIVAASWFWASFVKEGAFASSEAGIVTRYTVLDQIRCGNIAAAEKFLELQMDGDLVATAQFVRDGHRVSEGVRKVAQKERAARRTSAYQPMVPELVAPVRESLDLLAGGVSVSESR
jgi:hypothetical protein